MTVIANSDRMATDDTKDVTRSLLHELSPDQINWTLQPMPEPRDVLELTFYELPDAYRHVVAWLHGARLLISELLTALRAMTRERDQLRERVREQAEAIRQLRGAASGRWLHPTVRPRR